MKFSDLVSSFFGNSSGAVVGVDTGSSSIKVVELQDRNGAITLTTYGELQLGPYADNSIGEAVELSSDQEQAALLNIINEAAVQAKQSVFAMPLSSSFVTNVSIAADKDANLASLVRVEARKLIPASLNEVTLDWAEVETLEKNDKDNTNDKEDSEENRREVLIAAIQNVALSRFTSLMKSAGLGEPPTEIECFSAIRSLFDSEVQHVAIIDIGAESTKLYITRKGLLMRMHRVRAGGAFATRKIAQVFNISFEEAEAQKYAANSASENFAQLKRAHDESYLRAFREFAQVLHEYERKVGVEISAVHLAGGGALFTGIDRLLQATLHKPTVCADPFARVAYPAFMEDTLKSIGPTYTVALGAALRHFE